MNGALEGSAQRLGGEQQVASGSSGQGDPQDGQQALGQDYGTRHTWEDEGSHAADAVHHDADRASDRTEGQELDDFRRLYDPLRAEGAQALLTSVDGDVDEAGHQDTLSTRLTGGSEDASAPLVALPPGYKQAADQALSTEQVPAGYRQAVKQYFDAME
jgi:hypothetical protein